MKANVYLQPVPNTGHVGNQKGGNPSRPEISKEKEKSTSKNEYR